MSTLQVGGPHKSDRKPVSGRAWLMLALATLGFAVNFWAWALIQPLGTDVPRLGIARRDMTESDVALLVAVPVLVDLWAGSSSAH